MAGMHLLGEGGVARTQSPFVKDSAASPWCWSPWLPGSRGSSVGPAEVQERGGRGAERHARDRARSGAGAQELLESLFRKAGRAFKHVVPVAVARGHRAVRRWWRWGGDVAWPPLGCGDFGLHFEPLAEARFDLVFPATLASDSRVQALLDCLSNARFRRTWVA